MSSNHDLSSALGPLYWLGVVVIAIAMAIEFHALFASVWRELLQSWRESGSYYRARQQHRQGRSKWQATRSRDLSQRWPTPPGQKGDSRHGA